MGVVSDFIRAHSAYIGFWLVLGAAYPWYAEAVRRRMRR